MDLHKISSRSAKTNLSTIEHTFSETYERGKNGGYGIDYIFDKDSSDQTINSLTLEEYRVRRVDEFRKYFSAGKGSVKFDFQAGRLRIHLMLILRLRQYIHQVEQP
jgi:hypothetical protein